MLVCWSFLLFLIYGPPRFAAFVVQSNPSRSTVLFSPNTSLQNSVACTRRHCLHRCSLQSVSLAVSRDNEDNDGILVVKYGGNAMTSPELARMFCEDVAALQSSGKKLVVVHGGGPQISSMLNSLEIESKFSESGMRISTPEVVKVAEMVLCGSVNKQIAGGICHAGGSAIGLSGRDNGILRCVQKGSRDEIGYVGNVDSVNTSFLRQLLDLGVVPVLSPIGTATDSGDDEVVYNVNADVAAGRVAGALGASKLLFLTDVAGVLDGEKALLEQLTVSQCQDLIEDGTIYGGMIPKVSYATDAIAQGVANAVIVDGRVEHALLKQVQNAEGGGTTIHE